MKYVRQQRPNLSPLWLMQSPSAASSDTTMSDLELAGHSNAAPVAMLPPPPSGAIIPGVTRHQDGSIMDPWTSWKGIHESPSGNSSPLQMPAHASDTIMSSDQSSTIV